MITDNIIRETLTRIEARELLNLIRKWNPPLIFTFEEDPEDYFTRQREDLKNLKEWKASTYSINRCEGVIRAWDLYKNISDDPKERLHHWERSYGKQQEIKKSYKKMARPPRQDNKTYHNTQEGWGAFNKNKIRYPRKKRKTAWKRFYKLFPHLKPTEDHE